MGAQVNSRGSAPGDRAELGAGRGARGAPGMGRKGLTVARAGRIIRVLSNGKARTRRGNDEEDLPAEGAQGQGQARVQTADVYSGWQEGTGAPSRQGQEAPNDPVGGECRRRGSTVTAESPVAGPSTPR